MSPDAADSLPDDYLPPGMDINAALHRTGGELLAGERIISTDRKSVV